MSAKVMRAPGLLLLPRAAAFRLSGRPRAVSARAAVLRHLVGAAPDVMAAAMA